MFLRTVYSLQTECASVVDWRRIGHWRADIVAQSERQLRWRMTGDVQCVWIQMTNM